jgi:hypothetical protein
VISSSNKIISNGKYRADSICIIALILFCFVLIAPAAYFGIPENYDLGQHLRLARTFADEFKNGGIYPSLSLEDNKGLGSVGVRFYPPMTPFVLAANYSVFGSWYEALWITMLLFSILGSIGTYLFVREWEESPVSLAASVAYALAPYRLLQIFQAYLLAEFAAASILPFCFWLLFRLLKKPGLLSAVWFAVGYSLLVLAHLPTAVLGTACFAVFTLAVIGKEHLLRKLFFLLMSGLMVLALTAFYWVRLVTELGWVMHNSPAYFASGFYNYKTYFFPMLISAGDDYFPRFLWLIDLTIVFTILLFLPLTALLIRRKIELKENGKILSGLFATGIFGLLMLSLVSRTLWDAIGVLQKIQFPFRWLGVVSLAGAVLFVVAIKRFYLLSQKQLTRKLAYPLTALAVVVLIFDLTQVIIPSAPLPRDEIQKIVDGMDKEPGCECWWPVWAKSSALEKADKLISTDREAEVVYRGRNEFKFEVTEGEKSPAEFAIFYYPHWQAYYNQTALRVEPAADGRIAFELPPEAGTLTLKFEEPEKIVWAKAVSVLGFFVILVLMIILQSGVLARPATKDTPAED